MSGDLSDGDLVKAVLTVPLEETISYTKKPHQIQHIKTDEFVIGKTEIVRYQRQQELGQLKLELQQQMVDEVHRRTKEKIKLHPKQHETVNLPKGNLILATGISIPVQTT